MCCLAVVLEYLRSDKLDVLDRAFTNHLARQFLANAAHHNIKLIREQNALSIIGSIFPDQRQLCRNVMKTRDRYLMDRTVIDLIMSKNHSEIKKYQHARDGPSYCLKFSEFGGEGTTDNYNRLEYLDQGVSKVICDNHGKTSSIALCCDIMTGGKHYISFRFDNCYDNKNKKRVAFKMGLIRPIHRRSWQRFRCNRVHR